jgi:hypothetical protein
MPEYVLRNIDPQLWSEFIDRGSREGWPTRALIVALMDAYARGEISLHQRAPRELPQFGWLRAYYRQAAQRPSFASLGVDAQWKHLKEVVLGSPAGLSHGLLDEIPTDRRSEVLSWLQRTSNVPGGAGLTLRAIAHVGESPDLRKNRRAFQYEVLGLPAGRQAWIADFDGGWRILRVVDGVQEKEWGAPHATKEDARDTLAETLE